MIAFSKVGNGNPPPKEGPTRQKAPTKPRQKK